MAARRFVTLALGLALATGLARASNIHVELTADSWAMPDGSSPRSLGVPLPPGRAPYLHHLRVVRNEGDPTDVVPAQFEPLATWPDGSLRWVLVDFVAERPSRNAGYALTQDPFIPAPRPVRPVVVTSDAAAFTIDTGAARFVVPRTGFRPFASVRVGATEVVAAPGTDVVLESGGVTYRASADAASTVAVERSGPLRATLLFAGTFRDGGGAALLAHRTRVHFFAGESFVKVETTLENTLPAVHPGNVWDLGSSGSRYVDDLSIVIPLAQPATTWTTWPDGTPVSGALAGSTVLYQESSGGNRWNWRTHVNRFNVVPMTIPGWELRVDAVVQGSGARALGLLDLSSAAGGVAAAHRYFWQEFPKALRAAAPGALEVSLFPREFPDEHEIQGGEAKTHEVWLYFHEGDAAAAQPDLTLEELLDSRPVEIERREVARSTAAGLLPAIGCPSCGPYEDTVRYMVLDQGVRSFFTQREEIDEYGWRHFGEAFADHETDCGTQCWDCPISHDNNQYDYDWAALVQWFRTSGRGWFQLADEGIRHLRDIDVYHAEGDTPVYDHGMFWHTTHDTDAYTATHRSFSALMSPACTPYLSGGPGLGHLYTEGLLLHGMVTGDRRSLEVHEELRRYLLARYAADDPRPGSGYEPRAWANALRTAVESCRHDPGSATCALADRIVRDSDAAGNPGIVGTSFQDSMLMVALGRYLDMKAERGERADAMGRLAFSSLEEYARRVQATYAPARDVLDFRYSEGFWYAFLHAPAGDPDKETWRTLGRAYFDAGQMTPWFSTYITNKGLAHVASNGQLHAYFEEGAIPGPVTDLRVRRDPTDPGTALLTWSLVATDIHGNAPSAPYRYHVHRAADRPTRFDSRSLPLAPRNVDMPSDGIAPLTFYDVRAFDTQEGD